VTVPPAVGNGRQSEFGEEVRVIEAIDRSDLRTVDRHDHDPVGTVPLGRVEVVAKRRLTICTGGDEGNLAEVTVGLQ